MAFNVRSGINLSNKPWLESDANIAEDIYIPHGMLGAEERAALFLIGRDYCDGRGHIVDAGAFLGTSAFSLASGLAHSSNPRAKNTKIFSYDIFRADEDYVTDFIKQRFQNFDHSSSFRAIYNAQIGAYRESIVPMEGDFCETRWFGGAIEVLFVDLDKSYALHRTFLQEYYPHLIPSHSLLLHQDWYLSRHPWLHYGMEYLSEYFSIVDPLVKWCTRVFRLEAAIPLEDLSVLANQGLGYEKEIYLLDRLLEREAGEMKDMLTLSKITHRLARGDREQARKDFDSAAFASFEDPSFAGEWRHVSGLVT